MSTQTSTVQSASTPASKPSGKDGLGSLLKFQGYLGLLIVFIAGAIVSPSASGTNLFLELNNQMNILRYVSVVGIMAVGMTLVILIAEIDLSVGAMLAFLATLTAYLLMVVQLPTPVAFLIVIAAGAVLGGINGTVTTRLAIPSFVTTLAMMSVARGLARLSFGGKAIPLLPLSMGGKVSEATFFVTERIGGVLPIPAVVLFVVALIASLCLKYTPFGRHVYAIGGNPVAARLSGVRVRQTKVIVFAIAGVCAALASYLHALQLNQGAPNDGVGYELNAIAAVVIGGTSLMGGIGTIAGTIAGAWMLGMIDNILNLNNVESDVQLLVKGALIVVAVSLQRLQRRT
ncbi:MAG: ABC transporter permease [Proteobacteria bacterium]|nr:ABC transporter permease [Pseudomonadota bacterium]